MLSKRLTKSWKTTGRKGLTEAEIYLWRERHSTIKLEDNKMTKIYK